ncbi:hypothetical protein CRG98_041343 [Punica granatum]|uniref:Uncharacterized protein n=1 Tax=Punica granatum TaxID=22663 RepID=A0A2I0I4C3_PUNGR|nr:hypothetical protein CRG98_041343 [Punica granatum]
MNLRLSIFSSQAPICDTDAWAEAGAVNAPLLPSPTGLSAPLIISLSSLSASPTSSFEAFLYRSNNSAVSLVPSPTTASAHPLPEPPERAQINDGSSHVLVICCWVLS